MMMNRRTRLTILSLALTASAIAYATYYVANIDESWIINHRLRRCGFAYSLTEEYTPYGEHAEMLVINDPSVTNIANLKGLPIVVLDISRTSVTDISPLRDVKLAHIIFDPSIVRNWQDILRGKPYLEDINNEMVRDFWKEYDSQKELPAQPALPE